MSRTLTAAIENESSKSRLRAIDLIKVVFPAPIGTVYWSSTVVMYNGCTYIPRISAVGNWKRSMSAETEEVTIELANQDGEITKIFNSVYMEMAEVSLIRYYPDLDEAIDPLWFGYGGTISLNEDTATWKVHFGLRGMSQRGLRKLASNCWKNFKDDNYCPYTGDYYDNVDHRGMTALLFLDMDTVTDQVLAGEAWRYIEGEVVKIDDEEMLVTDTSQVQMVGGPYYITVIRGYNGTIPALHYGVYSGIIPTYIFHLSCTKTLQACRRRGMDGPENADMIPSKGYRYFGGWDSSLVPEVFKYTSFKAWTAYTRSTKMQTNMTVQGRVIPVIYGEWAIKEAAAIYSIDSGADVHSLFILSEGEVSAVAVNTIKVGNSLVDANPIWPGPSQFETKDSCVVWWGSPGQRESYCAGYNKTADTYVNNPYMINSAWGIGPSLSDLFAIRTRIEEDGDARKRYDTEFPSISVQVIGRKVRTVNSYINDDVNDTTTTPDVIEVALDYCVNGKFGPKLDVSKVNLTVAKELSDYCRALITSTDESVTSGTQVSRFLFNGCLNDDKSAETQLEQILENCNGYYIQNNALLEFGIRKAEDYDIIDAYKTLTDTGTDRNILRSNGKSSLQVEETSGIDGYVNNLEVSFCDINYSWQNNLIYISDDLMQRLAAVIMNADTTKVTTTKRVELLGTSSLDQAQRLGVLKLREEYLRRVKYTFSMSLKDSISLAPGDVRRLDSYKVDGDENKQLSKKATYIRIWEIEETDKFQANVVAYRHDNDYYDNTP